MRTRPILSIVLALSLAFPFPVFAQDAPGETPVQPVPYAPSQPVPYPGAAPPPAGPVITGTADTRGAALPPGADIVYLKGGGMIRGTLLEAIPGDHATVQLATGQNALVPWARVERIDRGGASLSVTPAPKEGAASSEASAVVHVEADRQVVLERRDARGGPWMLACSSPCDLDLPLSSTYRISGAGIRNSSPFHIDARKGEHVVIDVNVSSRGAFVGGIVLAGTGALLMLVGAMVLYTVSAEENLDHWGGSYNRDDSGANTAGWVLVIGGAVMTLGGVLLPSGNVHSKVQQSVGSPRVRNDAWLRLPTWHEDKTGSALPRVTDVPLFHTAF